MQRATGEMEVVIVRRRGRLSLHPHHAQFVEAVERAGAHFGQQEYREALGVYERFAAEHPDVYAQEIEHRTQVLRDYIEQHIEAGAPVEPEPQDSDTSSSEDASV